MPGKVFWEGSWGRVEISRKQGLWWTGLTQTRDRDGGPLVLGSGPFRARQPSSLSEAEKFDKSMNQPEIIHFLWNKICSGKTIIMWHKKLTLLFPWKNENSQAEWPEQTKCFNWIKKDISNLKEEKTSFTTTTWTKNGGLIQLFWNSQSFTCFICDFVHN